MIQRLEQYWTDWKSIYFYYIENNYVLSTLKVEVYKTYMILDEAYTHEGYRRQGYCSKLVECAVKEFEEDKDFFLIVNKGNHSAIKIYKEHGFKFHSVYEKDNQYEWMIYDNKEKEDV